MINQIEPGTNLFVMFKQRETQKLETIAEEDDASFTVQTADENFRQTDDPFKFEGKKKGVPVKNAYVYSFAEAQERQSTKYF